MKCLCRYRLADSFLSVVDAILIVEARSGPKYFAMGNLDSPTLNEVTEAAHTTWAGRAFQSFTIQTEKADGCHVNHSHTGVLVALL